MNRTTRRACRHPGLVLLAMQLPVLSAIPAVLAQTPPETASTMAAPAVFESGLRSLAVAWTEPAAGDPPVTGYDLQYRATGGADWTDGPQDVTATNAAIGDLSKDTKYQVRVRANRTGDEGAWSPPGEGATALWTAALTVGADRRDSTNYVGYERRRSVFGHLNPTLFSYEGVEYDIFILAWYRGRRHGIRGVHTSALDFYTVRNPIPNDWVLRVGSKRYFAADAVRTTYNNYDDYDRAEKVYWPHPDIELLLDAQYDVAISRASAVQSAASSSAIPPVSEPIVSSVSATDSLTAAFESVPAMHDGSTPFHVGLRFSEAVDLSFTAFTSGLLNVSGGTVSAARRLNPYNRGDNIAWVIALAPQGNGDVVVTMPAGRACNPSRAPCTPNGGRLGNAPTATISGPADAGTGTVAPLTARFWDAPASHDGSTAFTFRLQFSEEVNASYAWFADSVFTLTGGRVTGARRLAPSSNVGWEVRVVPDGNGDVVVVLPANRDCAQTGAICTADGRTLQRAVSLTVPGPEPEHVPPSASIVAGAGPITEGTVASFTVSLDAAATEALSVPVTVSESGEMLSSGRPAAVAFAAGERTKTVTLATSDDEVIEAHSDVTVRLGAGDGFTVGTPSEATLTVRDNDTAAFRVSAAQTTIDEGGATTITVAIVNGKTFAEERQIALSASGSASASDFTLSPATLALVSGSVSATLTAVDDADEEPEETVTVAARLGGSVLGSATVAIRASDRALSGDATLAALSLSGVDFGTFSPSTTSYSADVDHDVADTTVTARANHARATVSIAGSSATAGSASRAVDLTVGANSIAVTVTAEDETALTYTVAVTRAEASEEVASEGDLRLVDGSGPHEGRVEIYHSGRWGTVCDDFWSQPDAMVVCRQLGYTGRATALRRAFFGEGEDPIWLDNVDCDGDEARLADCPSRGWGRHNCGHHEDAGVTCGTGQSATSFRDTSVAGDRLTLRFGGQLNAASTPSPADFAVLATGARGAMDVPVRDVAVNGAAVVLGLARPVVPSEEVSVSYLESPMHPIEDESGNLADPLDDVPARHQAPDAARPGGAGGAVPGARPVVPLPSSALLAAARRGVVKLEQLDLSANNLSDAAAVRGLEDLERLGLRGNAISDLSALSGLTGLERLDLSNNRVEDIGALVGLVNLRRLDLSGNRIADIRALAGLVNLRRLDLSDNRIADLSALAGLPQLEVLLLDGNAIGDLWALAPLPAPANLSLSRNAIADVAPLAGFGALRRLDLSGNGVVRVDALGSLPQLAWLRIERNPLGNLLPLQGLAQLRWVWVDAGAPVSRVALPPGCCLVAPAPEVPAR